MYSQLVNSILNEPGIAQSTGSFGEETEFIGEKLVDEGEDVYPYHQRENSIYGGENYSIANDKEAIKVPLPRVTGKRIEPQQDANLTSYAGEIRSPFIDIPLDKESSEDFTVEASEQDWDNREMEENQVGDYPEMEEFTMEEEEGVQINVERAITVNKKYQTELWGDKIDAILAYFSSIGITKNGLPADAKYFALAVAKWQGTVFQTKKSIDGVLGPASWKVLKPRLTGIPATIPAQALSRGRQIIKNTALCPAVPLLHGEETYRHMVDAIQTATDKTHYIYILGWMLNVDFELIPGNAGSKLSTLLQKASERGVEIRALIWDNPLYINDINKAADAINALPNSILMKDNATYGSAGLKNAISTVRLLLAQAPFFLKFFDSWNNLIQKINVIQNEGSHHEKVLVVKGNQGLIGFCGGIDINPNRVVGTDSFLRSTVLHDIHCEVRGYAAWVLLHRFIWRWQVYKSQRVPGVDFQTKPAFLRPLSGEGEKEPAASAQPAANTANVKILQTYNHPDGKIKDRSIRETVKLAIMNARKTIHIEDQYMISLEIASWLNFKLASEPGFQSVTIVTQDDDILRDELLFPKNMRKKFIDTLEKDLHPNVKAKIFIRQLDRSKPPIAHHLLHSKIYIIDEELAIIGSANLSSRSMTHDSETAAVIFSDPGSTINFAKELKRKEDSDPARNVVPYTPNAQIKDLDIAIIDDINNPPTAVKVALSVAGPLTSVMIQQAVKLIITQLKPAIIDIIDPDADYTQPQQEFEEWLEQVNESSLYQEIDLVKEAGSGMEPVNTMEEYTPGNENEKNGYTTDTFEKWNNGEANSEDEYNMAARGYNYLRDQEISEAIQQQVAIATSPPVVVKPCEGRTCWAKEVLNDELGLSLPMNNTLDDQTKTALGNFQSKNNLPQTQKIDPATERSLLESYALYRNNTMAAQQTPLNVINAANTKIEDWTKQAVNTKPQFILDSYRDPRKVYAFVLHHMSFKRRGRVSKQFSDPTSYLSTGAHFCIMLDGRIIQLHALSRMIWHGNCISPRSVAVEFEGNFPDIKGKWWIDKTSTVQNYDHPTQAQYDSGRFLASYLKIVLGITHILAHRQSSDSRENDPGPDIWYNVGQWAMDKLGLSDGGPTFKCETGKPILPEWRTWGSKPVQPELEEYPANMEQAEPGEDFEPGDGETVDESHANDEEYAVETEQLVKDWQQAIRQNHFYAEKLGWQQYYNEVNDLLLPFSGQTAVSLGEEDFAKAVEAWQTAHGFTGTDADGIIGPHTWSVMSQSLPKIKSTVKPITTPVRAGSSDEQIIEGVRFKKKNNGWAAYGGGDLKKRLQELKQKGSLVITQNEIEMFGLISIPESGGLVNAINSWDSAYMSMGFIQFTIRFYELQEVIKKAPEAFKKHGIELDYPRLYFKDEKRSVAIKNAPAIADLRTLEWAVKFYKAGLEDDAIIAQVNVAREILNDLRKRYDIKNYLARFDNFYPNLWAFIYESNNSRPAVLHVALKNAIIKAEGLNVSDPVEFGKMLIAELNTATYNYYSSQVKYSNEEEKAKRIKDELAKVGRIIQKTGITQ